MRCPNFPMVGLALSIVRKGEVEFMRGFGTRDGQSLPVDEDTLFGIGSCSKAFTSAGKSKYSYRYNKGGLDGVEIPH